MLKLGAYVVRFTLNNITLSPLGSTLLNCSLKAGRSVF